jgi:hypothetical protein
MAAINVQNQALYVQLETTPGTIPNTGGTAPISSRN